MNPFALSLTLGGFSIREKDGTHEFLGWRRLYLRLDPLRSLWSAWGLSRVELDGFSARVLLGSDKAFNFADILARFAAPPGAPAANPAPGRPIRVGHLSVTGARLVFEDRSRKEPFVTTVGPMTFTLSHFSTAPQPGAPYRFDAVTEAGERLAWSGTLEAVPLGSVGDFHIESIELPKYAPYYAQWVSADLASGRLSLSGHYELSLAEGAPVMKLTDGTVAVQALKVSEKGSREVAIDLPSIEVAGIPADALARKADIQSVSIAGGRLAVSSQQGRRRSISWPWSRLRKDRRRRRRRAGPPRCRRPRSRSLPSATWRSPSPTSRARGRRTSTSATSRPR